MKKLMSKWMILCLAVVVIAVGTVAFNTSTKAADNKAKSTKKVELIVSAAASLQQSMEEIKAKYEKSHPGIKLALNFGASGALQKQIEQGAPADLFFSAGAKQMKALLEKNLIDSKQQASLLTNDLVLIVPAKSPLTEAKLKNLENKKVVKIALGEPETVPAGNYAKQTLNYYKLWDALESKFVYGKDVKQVLTYVESGNVEAGFVFKTDALGSKKVKTLIKLDAASHDPITYPAGVVSATKHGKEAAALFSYLQSKEAVQIFTKYGFGQVKR